MQSHPSLTPPQPLHGQDTPFTRDTFRRRLPSIVRRLLAENDLTKPVAAQIKILLEELPDGPIRPLPEHVAPDLADWQTAIQPFGGQTWLQVPWFFAETYLFRRIAAVVDYFRTGLDPYRQQKRASLAGAIDQSHGLAGQLGQMIAQGWNPANFQQLLLADLWGNQADLSMWAAGDEAMPNHDEATQQLSHLLIDDRTAVGQLLRDPVTNIQFVIDNAGVELVGDLCLADYLLATGRAAGVRFHLKLFPTFVSDATILDVEQTVATLRRQGDREWWQLGERLTGYLINGRLRLTTHPFWTSPYPLWQLPADLYEQLGKASLLLFKGDANYRRALGDARWPHDTLIADIVNYLPIPALFLRTCKSEVLAGLAEGQAARLQQADRDWLINGRWGVIQLA